MVIQTYSYLALFRPCLVTVIKDKPERQMRINISNTTKVYKPRRSDSRQITDDNTRITVLALFPVFAPSPEYAVSLQLIVWLTSCNLFSASRICPTDSINIIAPGDGGKVLFSLFYVCKYTDLSIAVSIRPFFNPF